MTANSRELPAEPTKDGRLLDPDSFAVNELFDTRLR
jgi:hypothetical protein